MPSKVDRAVAGRAMVLAPSVGLVLGGAAAGVVALVHWVQPGTPLLAAVLGVLVLVVGSGALHLDGLADFADALGSRRDRETMLRIMKQSDIGPFGVVAIVAVLLIDVAALTACLESGFGWQAVLVATTVSRLTLPWSCHRSVPTARPDGLGAVVASTVSTRAAVLSTVLVTTLCTALAWLTFPTPEHPLAAIAPSTLFATDPFALAATVLAVLLAVGTGLTVVRRARTTLGGITGDVLGAATELALATTLLTLAFTT